MKLTRTLNISETEFYDYLEQDLSSTIFLCEQTEVTTADIKKGLRYSKYAEDTHARMDIEVLAYQRGSFYQVRVKTMADTILLSYESTPVPDGLQIIFQQHIDSFENKKHNRFMKLFSEGIYYGRMSDTLFEIQKKIIQKRDGIEEMPKPKPFEHKHIKKLLTKKQ